MIALGRLLGPQFSLIHLEEVIWLRRVLARDIMKRRRCNIVRLALTY